MTAVIRRLLAAALLALTACNTGFNPQYRVDDTRILAVRHQVQGTPSTADVAPGETVVLEALIARPRDGTRVTWIGCLPPASEAITPCADRALLENPEALRGRGGVLLLGAGTFPAAGAGPDLVASVTVSLADPAMVGSLDAALDFALAPARSDPAFACRLYTEIDVVALVEAPSVRPQAALKRVRVTSLEAIARNSPYEGFGGVTLDPASAASIYTTNLNPAIANVRVGPTNPGACSGGTVLASGAAFPGGRVALCGVGDAGQQTTQCDADGPRPSREEYGWQWYVTAGEFADQGSGVGNVNESAPEFERPPGPFSMWTILRDQRGGISWTRRDYP